VTETLTRAKGRIDDPDELERVVHRIVEQVDPVAIYLFGSRARGDADEHSDYDLLVVVPDDAPKERLWHRVWDAAKSRRIAANAMVRLKSDFALYRHAVGSLSYEVEVDGIQLWPLTGTDLRDILPRPRSAGSMSAKVLESWLRRVERDLRAARKCCEGEDAIPDQGAYHVQQAAEKLTKAVLVAHTIRPRKGHKIEEFAPLIPTSFPHRDRFLELEEFSKYAWAHRYPLEDGREPIVEPSVAEVKTWIDDIEALKADFERWLEQAASGAKRG
jgi:predicted nucleotidyltransferase/HEPN domain-containing protein